MKRIIALFTIVFVLALASCGSPAEEGGASSEKEKDAGQVSIGGVALTIGMEMTDHILDKLGQPTDILSAPSCHFDGEDTIYEYENYALYTYMDNDKSRLYLVEITGGDTAFESGAALGMSLEQIKSIYGADYREIGLGIQYDLADDLYVTFTLDEDVVVRMEIGMP